MFLLREMKWGRQVLEDDCNSNATGEGKDEKWPGNSFLGNLLYVIREIITLYRLTRWRGCVDHKADSALMKSWDPKYKKLNMARVYRWNFLVKSSHSTARNHWWCNSPCLFVFECHFLKWWLATNCLLWRRY